MKHGGDVLSYKNLYDGKLIDFSSNINPFGTPKNLKNKLLMEYENVITYPDIKYRELKNGISNYLGCYNGQVIVGNGAVEIIDNICRMFNRVIIFTPSFSEYMERAVINGKDVVSIPMDKDFKVNKESLIEVLKEGDLIILGNPNNPTGRRIDKETLLDIYNLVSEKNAFLLLDEAFYEFCPEDYNSIELFGGRENICIIRAATKFFALPGIRLGYACAGEEFVKSYNEFSLPWSVNSFAETAGRYIFRENEYIKISKEYINLQRQFLLSELNKINFLRVFNSHCNFILLKLIDVNEEKLFNFLLQRGILIRRASSFKGLDESYVRVAVKDLDSNKKLTMAFEEFQKCMQ